MLSSKSVKAMQTPTFAVPGSAAENAHVGLGWMIAEWPGENGPERIIGHGGDTRWFHTDLALIPEEKLGVFVSYNPSTGGELA